MRLHRLELFEGEEEKRMRSNHAGKYIKAFFIFLTGALLLTGVSAGAAQYRAGNIFPYDDETDYAITVGSYYINYKDETLTASKIVNGEKVHTTVLDTHCAPLERCNVLTNGKKVFYFKRVPNRNQVALYRINVNGKGKKKVATCKGIRTEFHAKIGSYIYFTCAIPGNSIDGTFYDYLYCCNIKNGKVTTLLKKYSGEPYTYFGSRYLVTVKYKEGESNDNSIIIRYYDYLKRKIVKTNIIKHVNGFRSSGYDETIVGKYLYLTPTFSEYDTNRVFYDYDPGPTDKDTVYRVPLTTTQKPVRVFESAELIYIEKIIGNYVYYTKRDDTYQFFRVSLKTKAIEKLTKKRYVKLTGFAIENYD